MVAELEDEMQFPLPSENLNQVHQVRVLQVLQHSAHNDATKKSGTKRAKSALRMDMYERFSSAVIMLMNYYDYDQE